MACPECAATVMVESSEGDLVCTGCGVVMEQAMMASGIDGLSFEESSHYHGLFHDNGSVFPHTTSFSVLDMNIQREIYGSAFFSEIREIRSLADLLDVNEAVENKTVELMMDYLKTHDSRKDARVAARLAILLRVREFWSASRVSLGAILDLLDVTETCFIAQKTNVDEWLHARHGFSMPVVDTIDKMYRDATESAVRPLGLDFRAREDLKTQLMERLQPALDHPRARASRPDQLVGSFLRVLCADRGIPNDRIPYHAGLHSTLKKLNLL